MEHIKDLECASPFEAFVARQSLKYTSGLKDSVKGYYNPTHPSLVFNFNYSEMDQEYQNLSKLASSKIKTNKQPLWFSTFIHELIHCYHIAGSSIGSVYNLCHGFQKNLIKKKISDYKIYKQNRHFYLNNVEPFIHWKHWQDTRCLLGNGYDQNLFAPGLKDYIGSITWVMFNFISMYNHITENDIDYGDRISILTMDMAMKANVNIDYLMKPIDSLDNLKDIEKYNYFVHPLENMLFIPTRSVLEGYARMCEINNIALLSRLDGIFAEKGLGDVIKQKGGGIYGATVNIMRSFINYCDFEQFHQTALSIYELSLMIRLHPLLFCEGDKPNLNEMFVPMRFKRLLLFFNKNKTTISDYCNTKDGLDLIKGLDKICDELNWMRYSDTLKKLIEFYEFEDWKDTYDSHLAMYVLKSKLEGKVYIDNLLEIDSVPVVMMFKDWVKPPDQSKFSGFSGDFEKEALRISVRMIEDTFTQEFVYSSNFNSTIECFKRFIFDKDFTKSEIGGLLEQLNLIEFIKPEEIMFDN